MKGPAPLQRLRQDFSIRPPGGGPAQGPRGRGRGLPGEGQNLPQWQGRGRSVGAVPIWAAVWRGWEEGSPARALDPTRGHQQPPLKHSSHSVLAVGCGPPVDALPSSEVSVQPSAECGQREQHQQEGQGHGSPGSFLRAWGGAPGCPRRCSSPRGRGSPAGTGTATWAALPFGHLSLYPGAGIASRPRRQQGGSGHRWGIIPLTWGS